MFPLVNICPNVSTQWECIVRWFFFLYYFVLYSFVNKKRDSLSTQQQRSSRQFSLPHKWNFIISTRMYLMYTFETDSVWTRKCKSVFILKMMMLTVGASHDDSVSNYYALKTQTEFLFHIFLFLFLLFFFFVFHLSACLFRFASRFVWCVCHHLFHFIDERYNLNGLKVKVRMNNNNNRNVKRKKERKYFIFFFVFKIK